MWREWAAANGLDGEAVARSCHGVPSVQHVADWAPRLDPVAESEAIEAAQVSSGAPTPAFPGAAELLRAAPRVAIVTSGTPALAARRLRSAGLAEPELLLCAGEVPRGKPAPDPYLEAARRLGVPVADCLVVEDAPAGVAAGVAAGARTWAVEHTHPRAELADADRVFADLPALLAAL